MRKWKLEERKRLTHPCTGMESEFSQTFSVMVAFAVRCKWKPIYFRTRFRASEKRQLLTGSVPGGKPVLLTFRCWELKLWFFRRIEGLSSWGQIWKEIVPCLWGFQPARTYQAEPVTLCSPEGGVFWCSWAKRIGLSRLPAGTSCSCGFWGLNLLRLLNHILFLWF